MSAFHFSTGVGIDVTVPARSGISVAVPPPAGILTSVAIEQIDGGPGHMFFVDEIPMSFLGVGGMDTVPPSPIRSPKSAPGTGDTRAVADTGPGLDTRCTFRSGGPLQIHLPIERVVGQVDAAGELLEPASLIGDRYLSKLARIDLSAYDVDADEIDKIYVNGHYVGDLKQGANNQWAGTSLTFPVEWLRFGRASGVAPNEVNVAGLNEIRIDISTQAVNSDKRCVSVDWVSVEFGAIAPIFLVHGTKSSPRTWEETTPYLQSIGVPHSNQIQLGVGPTGSIANNGAMLAERLDRLARAFGAKACHIVAHSKGGNDTREYLTSPAYAPDKLRVLSFFTLSTPFRGTVIADIIWHARRHPGRGSTNDYIQDILSRDYSFAPTPCCDELFNNRTSVMKDYNDAHPFPRGVFSFYNLSADADLNDDGRISRDERIPVLPDFWLVGGMLDEAAESMYLALGTIKRIKVVDRLIRDSTGHVVARIPMIEVDQRTSRFEENDIVITVSSSQHPSAIYLGQLDANHSRMKSPATMQGILSRIRADFPIR